MKYNTALPHFDNDDISEILHEIEKILRGDGLLSMGRFVEEFEQSFSSFNSSDYSIATSSCTSALETVLTSLDVSAGDEVIVPAQTFIATGSAVARMGATPIFCEVNDNFLIDSKHMKKKINSRTKAVIIVHYAGLIHEDIFDIKEFLKDEGIFLIEDAAHAPGAEINDIRSGNLGDAGCFSFYSTKNMTTGEGGMITTDNKDLAEKARSIRSRGLDTKSSSERFINLGTNHRMTEFQALLGIYQLKRLKEYNDHRNMIARQYSQVLEPLIAKNLLEPPVIDENIYHSYWRYWIKIKNPEYRNIIQAKMKESSIQVDWAYSPLLHLQPVFKKLYNTKEGMLPKSEELASRHICLPIHYNISTEDAEFIAERFTKAILEVV